MHVRNFVFLIITIISLTSGSASAQRREKAGKVVSVDTIVLKKAMVKEDDCKGEPLVLKPKTINIVPLAGHKEYFGSMNDYVIGYTQKYMVSHNRTLCSVRGRCEPRFSLMDNVFKKHNIPKELKYLAVIESALTSNAVSPVGAVGPWQFMESTARMMGLTVNAKRDDRKDWFKSTTAAAKYLNYLYNELDDWLLVVAAYNSGPTPVQRAIQRTGSKSFWEIRKYLPKETQGHVLAFIATASIFEKLNNYIGSSIPKDFKFFNEDVLATEKKPEPKIIFTDEELKAMAIVRISDRLNLDLISQDLKIERRLLDKWNPDYDLFEMDAYEGDFYSLRIPKEKLDNFIDRKEFLVKRSKSMFTEMSM
jgi:membrane-bound lytic murein transglycosylase D